MAMTTALAIPIALSVALKAPVGTGWLIVIVGTATGLGIYHRNTPGKKGPAYASYAVFMIFGAVVLIGILTTPFAAYVAWFDWFQAGHPQGGVSSIFVLITAFFSSIGGILVFSAGFFGPLLLVGFVLLYLLGIILQTEIFAILILVYLFILVIVGVAGKGPWRKRRSVVFFTLLLFVLSVPIAEIVGGRYDAQGNRFVDDAVYPGLRKALITVFPRFPLLYAVPGYGVSFDEKQLGSKPTLLNDQLFAITAEPSEVLYLRTEVFDTYDNTSWEISPALSAQKTTLRSPEMFLDFPIAEQRDVRVEITARTFTKIPHTLDTTGIEFSGDDPTVRGSRNIGFYVPASLQANDVFVLHREEVQESTAALSVILRKMFLQLPSLIPDELRELRDLLKEDTSSPEEYLRKVELFLALNYAYDLAIEEHEYVGEDFVYDFLTSESGAGYCVQFASSFIILARLNGVPARYATGYLVYLPRDSRTVDVTGLSAHAWPEVWLDGQGWVTWEATPAANIANYTELGQDLLFRFNLRENSLTSRQLEGLLGRKLTVAEAGSADQRKVWEGWTGTVPIAAVAAAAVICLGLALRFGFPALRYTLQDERGRFTTTVKSLVRRLSRKGITNPKEIGWIAWIEEVKNLHPHDGEQLGALQDALICSSYGDNLFEPEYLLIAKAVSRNIKIEKRRADSRSTDS